MFRDGAAGDSMQLGTAVALALFLVAGGLVLIAAGRRATAGRLRRNPVVGIRTTLTLSSTVAWDAANRAGGRHLSIAGVGPLVTGPLLLTQPSNGIGLAIVGVGLAWMLAWILAGGVVGTRAAEEALEAEGE